MFTVYGIIVVIIYITLSHSLCYIKLEASESASVLADHHNKKSVLSIGCKNPDRSIPSDNSGWYFSSSLIHCRESGYMFLFSFGFSHLDFYCCKI